MRERSDTMKNAVMRFDYHDNSEVHNGVCDILRSAPNLDNDFRSHLIFGTFSINLFLLYKYITLNQQFCLEFNHFHEELISL